MPCGPSPPPCLGLLAVAFLVRGVRVLIRIFPFVVLALTMQPQLLTRSPLNKTNAFVAAFVDVLGVDFGGILETLGTILVTLPPPGAIVEAWGGIWAPRWLK